MSTLLADLHWLRPAWLLLLPALPLLLWLRRGGAAGAGAWREHCDPALLAYLGDPGVSRRSRWPLALLLLGWLLGVLALAGPAWERAELPVYRDPTSRVFVLDLSHSMDATDLVPSRLARARFKLTDLLTRAAGSRVGLVVFAGDAFALAPLTDDVNTLLNLVPALETALMPVQGSRAERGIERATELLRGGGARHGDIILITDGVSADTARRASDARAAGYRVSVLAVGTRGGAPIPEPDGGFLKDAAGRIVIPAVDSARLIAVANAGGGRFATLSIDDSDIDRLLARAVSDPLRDEAGETWRTAGQRWRDGGPWLLLALLPLAALAFRRGWLLVFVVMLLPPAPASALQWSDLWLRPEQRVHSALQAGDTEAALQAAREADPAWRGSALYRAGQFAAAAQAFAAIDDASAHYNRGNALARAGRLRDALAAYDRALAEQADFEDAAFNRELVESLLRQQEQEQQQQQQQQRQQDGGDGGEQASAGQPESQAGDGATGQRDDGTGEGSNASDAGGGAPREPEATPGDGARQADAGPQQQRKRGANADDSAPRADAGQLADKDPGDGNTTTVAENSAAAPLDDATAARIEQMLRRVPDDPGGLLRRKFALEHARRARQPIAVEQPW